MSREGPTEPPRAIPDTHRVGLKHESAAQRTAREDLERLKATRGPAFLAGFFNPHNRASMAAPKFIRAGYEASILDDLREFFAARPWRPKVRRSIRTHKERLNLLRRMEQAGQIRRCGGGRFELVKVQPHPYEDRGALERAEQGPHA